MCLNKKSKINIVEEEKFTDPFSPFCSEKKKRKKEMVGAPFEKSDLWMQDLRNTYQNLCATVFYCQQQKENTWPN